LRTAISKAHLERYFCWSFSALICLCRMCRLP